MIFVFQFSVSILVNGSLNKNLIVNFVTIINAWTFIDCSLANHIIFIIISDFIGFLLCLNHVAFYSLLRFIMKILL